MLDCCPHIALCSAHKVQNVSGYRCVILRLFYFLIYTRMYINIKCYDRDKISCSDFSGNIRFQVP